MAEIKAEAPAGALVYENVILEGEMFLMVMLGSLEAAAIVGVAVPARSNNESNKNIPRRMVIGVICLILR